MFSNIKINAIYLNEVVLFGDIAFSYITIFWYIGISIKHFYSDHVESFRYHSFESMTGNIPNDQRIHVQTTLIVFIINVLFKIKLYKNCTYCLFIAFLKGL